MNTNDILHADLLDILFENRNKDYGAYHLRRTYHRRLWIAVAIAAAIILLFILLQGLKTSPVTAMRGKTGNDSVVLRPVEFPRDIPLPQEQLPQPTPRSSTPVAQQHFTDMIDIVRDDLARATLPSAADVDIPPGDATVPGTVPDDVPRPPTTTVPATPVTVTATTPVNNFVADERAPEYPGGTSALHRFIMNNLDVPDGLQAGEKKTVHIRFTIGRDGKVSGFEIIRSAGAEYDDEVLRVCSKMPKWKPAFQNGTNVPVSYSAESRN